MKKVSVIIATIAATALLVGCDQKSSQSRPDEKAVVQNQDINTDQDDSNTVDHSQDNDNINHSGMNSDSSSDDSMDQDSMNDNSSGDDINLDDYSTDDTETTP